MNVYEHRQNAAWLVALLGGSALGCVVLAVVLAREVPVGAWIGGVTAAVLLLALWLFRCLTVRVTEETIEVAFGPGWPRKGIPLAEVVSVARVQNRWWYGFGIRFTPHGWLWNVSGLDAVEVVRASGRRFRIGTDDAAGLERAIRDALARR